MSDEQATNEPALTRDDITAAVGAALAPLVAQMEGTRQRLDAAERKLSHVLKQVARLSSFGPIREQWQREEAEEDRRRFEREQQEERARREADWEAAHGPSIALPDGYQVRLNGASFSLPAGARVCADGAYYPPGAYPREPPAGRAELYTYKRLYLQRQYDELDPEGYKAAVTRMAEAAALAHKHPGSVRPPAQQDIEAAEAHRLKLVAAKELLDAIDAEHDDVNEESNQRRQLEAYLRREAELSAEAENRFNQIAALVKLPR